MPTLLFFTDVSAQTRQAISSAPEASLTSENTPRTPADLALAESMIGLLRRGRDVRERKVRRLRAKVRMTAYENPLKLSVAIDRLVTTMLDAND